jgi:hypothetical protein
VLVRRKLLDGPGHKIDQRSAIGHVHLAQVRCQLGTHPLQISILGDIEALGCRPVAVALVAGSIAVHLGHDVHALAGADALGLIQVDIDVLLQYLVVGILVEHHQPRLPL